MDFAGDASEEELLHTLRRQAEASYGAQRAGEIESGLRLAAHDLWLLNRKPLQVNEIDPDWNQPTR